MDKNLIDIFNEQKECEYKGETYSVRDNGAVMRHCRKDSQKKRRLDEIWTFGKKSMRNGYMHIGTHRIHIIVATAFYGENDSAKLVVDHIDSNRCNNRVENLRWVTRLENALMNPATLKKIEYLCGDIETFISNPQCLRELSSEHPDIMWMRTVSAEEAKNACDRIMQWAKEPNKTKSENHQGEWIFSKPGPKLSDEQIKAFLQLKSQHDIKHHSIVLPTIHNDEPVSKIYNSLTYNAKQFKWVTPTLFPACPINPGNKPLEKYYSNLRKGICVSKNKFAIHYADDFAIKDDVLYIRTHGNSWPKKFTLIEIVFKDGYYVHSGRTFFEAIGAEKVMTLKLGKEWTKGDVFDDFC